VKVDLHVLRVLILHEIGGEIDHADVVAVDEGGVLEGVVEFLKKLAKPGGLGYVVGHSAILDLSAGAGDNVLPLRGPGDEVGAQKHDVAGCGSTRVGAASPVDIGVDHQLRSRGGSK
jgi:hypothetical protein